MKFVINCILIIFLTLFVNFSFTQKNSEKLKKEQELLEQKIANTKSLLDKQKSSVQSSLNELKMIDKQIENREKLLANFDNQIRNAELQIENKNNLIEQLNKKLESQKAQYKKLLINAYKLRSKEGKYMYIFSSTNYGQAFKRKKYLDKLAELSKKQKQLILQHQGLIIEEKINLEKEKEYKSLMATEKRKEKEQIAIDKQKQQVVLNELKGKEEKLIKELQAEERKRNILKQRINEAIRKEIAEAEKARIAKEKQEAELKRKREAEALAKAKAAESKTVNKSTANTSSSDQTATTTVEITASKKDVDFATTKELALSKNFETNKGKLPWPVEKGTITEGYGKHAHPSLPNVFTYNNGVDISTVKSAQVRAIFEGEVTSVLSIPGAGKVIIIKHGNYRTVYSNIQESYVNVGSKVSTKQTIGSLLVEDGKNYSIAHFELYHVVDGQLNKINPSIWIAQ